MSNSSEDDINVGENSKNVDIDSFKTFYNYLKSDSPLLKKKTLIDFLNKNGITETDNRLVSEIKKLNEKITEEDFIDLFNSNVLFFKKIFENDLIIKDWSNFTKSIDSIYEKAGLVNNDIIREINGVSLRDAGQAISLLNSLRGESDIEVKLDRGGSTMTLNMQVQ